MYGFLADVVVVVHFAYVLFVVLGQLAIFAGILRKWEWIRNPWFRWAHLIMICIVAAEAVLEMRCPLTDWEVDLRKMAGQKIDGDSFIGRLLNDVMFFDAPVDHWAFRAGYVAFAVLVIACLWLAPPRRRRVLSTTEVARSKQQL